MGEWERVVQTIVEVVDRCIQRRDDEMVTLTALSQSLGYSQYYVSRKFREIAGMRFREYLRQRALAFALKEVQGTERSLLDIALDGVSAGQGILLLSRPKALLEVCPADKKDLNDHLRKGSHRADSSSVRSFAYAAERTCSAVWGVTPRSSAHALPCTGAVCPAVPCLPPVPPVP